MKTIEILAPFAFAFVAIVTGCSGAAPEGSELQSSQLKGPAGGKGEGSDPGKGDPSPESGKDAPSTSDEGKGDPSDTDKGDPSDTPDKGDPGKDVPPSDGSCFVVVEKAACQSDAAWKDVAAKICDGKGYSLSALSTSDDCKGGSTVAKIECCQ